MSTRKQFVSTFAGGVLWALAAAAPGQYGGYGYGDGSSSYVMPGAPSYGYGQTSYPYQGYGQTGYGYQGYGYPPQYGQYPDNGVSGYPNNGASASPDSAVPYAQTRTVNPDGSDTGLSINFPRDRGDDTDVLRLQVFLDYNGFSVGEIDGRWGYNTERALSVYQQHNGQPQTGMIDKSVLQMLDSFEPGFLLQYIVTAKDLEGPFHAVPRSYSEQAKLSYLPYESVAEALGEKFHCSKDLLKKLNPRIDLENLQPGQQIMAVNTLNGADDGRGKVSLVKISKKNKWIEAFDGSGKFLFYYPTTPGGTQDDIPVGSYSVTKVVPNPPFTYNPALMWDAKPGEKIQEIPPGPNSPVGLMWIGTSRPSVGIHGTPNPENISKTSSHGCFRTCNWDAKQLAKHLIPDAKIEIVP